MISIGEATAVTQVEGATKRVAQEALAEYSHVARRKAVMIEACNLMRG